MEETGKIVEVSDKMAKVRLEAGEQCGHCEARIFCQPGSHNDREVSAINNINAKINDKVVIGTSSGISTLATFILFITPVLLFIGIFIIIRVITHKESLAIFGGFVGLILFFGLLVMFNQKELRSGVFKNKKFYPVIKEIMNEKL